MCNNKDFFERQQVEMLLSAELAKPYQEMDPDFIKECSDFLLQMDGYHAAHSTLSEEEVANRVKTILSGPEEVPQAVADFRLSGSNPRCTTLGHIKFLFHMGRFLS